MARTKRKIDPLCTETPMVEQSAVKRYRAAAYARLSAEDGGRPGAETLDSQKKLIEGYIAEQPDMELCAGYSDNGATGTDFERPGFERMMEAVRRGEVNCIVVKDLSRFGRNYKETGNYLERIFPFLDVRFVAINDRFDTLTAERGANGYIVPLKNLINEVYSKDISRKISCVVHGKQERGEFIGAWAPYGYSKDPEDKHKLVPNPDTAPVVQRIFQMRLQGMSYNKIARTLNKEGIASPARYLVDAGVSKSEKYAAAIWTIHNVKDILTRQVYIGHMVQGVKRQSFYEGRKQYIRDKTDWCVVKHTHPAIIDAADFAAAQAMGKTQRSAYQARLGQYESLGKSENILRGLVFCQDCGRHLVRYKNVSHGKKMWYTYICPTHTDDPASCPLKNIREDELFPILQEMISKQISLAVDLKTAADKLTQSKKGRGESEALQEELDRANKALKRCEGLRDSLYQSYVEQLMTEREYIMMKERYAAESEECRKRITKLEEKIRENKDYTAENRYLTAFHPCKGASLLTCDVLTALIERIEIGENKRVHIHFRYRDEFEKLTDYLKKEGVLDEYGSEVSSLV